MIYRPSRGAMWDPSILWHKDAYWAFMMYNRDGTNGLEAEHCLLAVSKDGVHWRDEAVVLEERDRARGGKFFKCMVARCGERFILDHGAMRPEGQDTLRFYESADLKRWTYIGSNMPDPRWYGLPPQPHRWDHMYILPKEEGRPETGYWGYPVAVPRPGTGPGVGMMESADGRTWTARPPAAMVWPAGLPARDHFEYGGCERLGGRYYLIGGTGQHWGCKGYGMFTLIADDPCGPFHPDVAAHRLCGNSEINLTWLAVWCRGHGELLISNYTSQEPGNLAPWLLPLRKPIVDSSGHLRLAWWPGNAALKGSPLALAKDVASLDGDGLTYLDERFDPAQGIVLEGKIRAQAGGRPDGAAGFAFDEGEGRAMALLLGIGPPENRVTRIGRLGPAADGGTSFEVMDVTGEHCATVTGIEDGQEHAFRLLSRLSLFELYLDDRLVQTFYYKPGAGRVGFVVRGARAEFTHLKAWRMSV